MKISNCISNYGWLVIFTLFAGKVVAQVPAGGTNGPAAKIQFQATTFDFGKISSGQPARHDFVFTNSGDAVLEITGVRPSCGCTTAGEWSKTVEPGKTGNIPLQFNSAGFSGMVVKTATVTCNDPAMPSLTLQLSGNVWKEIDAQPQFAVMNGSVESVTDAKATIKIVNNGESPIGITGLEISNPLFVAEVKTNQAGKEFELFIKAVPPVTPNLTHGTIVVKTTSTNVPQVQVTAMLMLQAVISVTPPQITLPPPPLANALIHTVTVRNLGTNVVKLSEPTVNDARVTAVVKEAEVGKAFSVEVNIPPGFEVKTGQSTEVVLRSTHPQYPELKIPILQTLSVPPPAPAVSAPVATPGDPAHAH